MGAPQRFSLPTSTNIPADSLTLTWLLFSHRCCCRAAQRPRAIHLYTLPHLPGCLISTFTTFVILGSDDTAVSDVILFEKLIHPASHDRPNWISVHPVLKVRCLPTRAVVIIPVCHTRQEEQEMCLMHVKQWF